ncbi:MAG TPA: MotA/TolQ/ExbB proton channel family protein [Tepidisphaeraceae bacterium]|nr:MotA/TolQ/ExbB proton channel family protein [Tepidisphaeraceae bacterium]
MWDLIARSIKASGGVELGVLYLLAAFSVASWALILMKIMTLGRARRNNVRFLSLFNASETVGEFSPPRARSNAPLAAIFTAAVDTLEKAGHSGVRHVNLPADKLHEKVMLRMQHTSKDELNALRWGSGFLASVGSASPFIGLFGTVWGIMATFQALGDAKSASLAVVAPGIASALIATAAGLVVAIPAVLAFNWIQGRVEVLQDDADTFVERMDFMTRTERAAAAPQRAGGVADPLMNDDDAPVMAFRDV